MQPQNLTKPRVTKYNRMQTKYKIRYRFNVQCRTLYEIKDEKTGKIDQQKDPETDKWVDRLEDKTKRLNYYTEAEDYVYIMHNTHSKDKINKTKYLGYAKDATGILIDKEKAYIDNADLQCFVFSYDQFLIAINETFGWLTSSLAQTDYDGLKPYKRSKYHYVLL